MLSFRGFLAVKPENAGILAAKMLGIKDENVRRKIIEHKNSLKQKVMDSCVGLHN